MHASLGHRAWFAWQCLPRDDRGRPPSWRSLEIDHDLPNATLPRIIWGRTRRPSAEILSQVAAALGTTIDWLLYERGEGPAARWPVVPRPDYEPARKAG
jgi:hypothetical protein